MKPEAFVTDSAIFLNPSRFAFINWTSKQRSYGFVHRIIFAGEYVLSFM